MVNSIRYLSAKEYAALFRVSYDAVIRACEKGRIEGACQPMGGRWRIPVLVPEEEK